ncbi:hypothetical protein HMI55_004449 [Coelomomyces lativittatus]|nr:hypothetical protein HMI55_004449 [Coelomomyces lativittatus]
MLSIFTDINLDETYTPRLISIRAGTSLNVMEEVLKMELEDPVGWFHYPLEASADTPLFCHVIQFCVLSNHHHGKDCHLRGLKVWGPKEKDPTDQFSIIPFTDDVFRLYSTVR